MKKYLMTGMAALAMCAAFTSCSKDTDFSDVREQNSQVNYETAFVSKYGQIASNQDWGFGQFKYKGANARVMTRAANENGNEWCKTYSNVPNPLTSDQITRVRMYFQANPFYEVIPQTFTTYFVQQVYKGGTNPGKNSAEKYPAADGQSDHVIVGGNQMDYLTVGTDHVHVSNFNNADAGTYGNVKDGYTYKDGYTPWTKETAAAAGKDWANAETENFNGLKEHPDKIMLMENTPTTCFGYWNSNASYGHDDMYVCIDGATIDAWAETQTSVPGEAVAGRYFVGFDFEQNPNVYYQDNGVDVMFEYGGKSYHYLSQSMDKYAGTKINKSDSELYVNGDMAKGLNDEVIAPLLRDGYLPVGGRNLREWVKVSTLADHYYSDWIVAITPAKLKSSTPDPTEPDDDDVDVRVFAEDLDVTENYSNQTYSGDFDFNDVVFDVVYNFNGETWIILRAAGGTWPLTVAGNEVHAAFGEATNVMINTKASGGKDGKAAVKINLHTSYTDANDIPVIVTLPNGQPRTLTAGVGEAPHKIAVRPGLDWMDERISIETIHSSFSEWVRDPSVTWYTAPRQ